jgi:hypothetical protein
VAKVLERPSAAQEKLGIESSSAVRCASHARVGSPLRPKRGPNKGMYGTRTTELPRARRAWIGPPIAALGSWSPRRPRGPVLNLCAQSNKAETTVLCMDPTGSERCTFLLCPRDLSASRLRLSSTSRDGVANEAPLSTVRRVSKSACSQREPYASTRPRFTLGAPLARQPTSSSSE